MGSPILSFDLAAASILHLIVLITLTMEAAVAMADHFDKIQKLPDKLDGAPNFRRVPGYKVYCCGQPTAAGFAAAINKACGTIYPKDGRIIWINMRQEPVI